MTQARVRTIAYWFLTAVVAWEMIAGSMWDLLQIEFVRTVFTHLGYPHYLLLIIGAWKLPCGVVWLLPRLPRLKEWAYAGAFFNYSGAAASHLLAGESAKKWIGPLVFALMTLGSWALRPPERRLAPAPPAPQARPVAWMVPIAVAAAMLAVALLTLPKGPAPY
jgi:hypothetical protein